MKRLKDILNILDGKYPLERFERDRLISYGLNITREQIYSEDILVSLEKEAFLVKLFQRRFSGEPIAYITGQQFFYKNPFIITSKVLIPRPETEGLVELALETVKNAKKIVDIGTGSGCIGLSLVKEIPRAHLLAIDISEEALLVAKENAKRLGVSDRVWFFKENAEDFLRKHPEEKGQWEVVVSNPPYLKKEDPFIEDSVLQYEPHEALFAPEEGLYFLKKFFLLALELLSPVGWGFFEIGADQAESMLQYCQGFLEKSQVSVKRDLAGRNRYLLFRKDGIK
ncbi:MAG: peptide chain release factor N(5)-glutamine methyltransferase [Bdellovibrio sp.]|nr:MAG: peptide chain release factor N(5)-glutamine methyltransferase [Bdellovibrio sp.]